MTNVITLNKSEEDFLGIIKEVKGSKKRYLLSHKGRPQAVIMGYDDYLKSILCSKRSKAVRKIQEEAKN